MANMPGMSDTADASNWNNMLSVQELMTKVKNSHIPRPYTIVYPSGKDGVYTVSKGSNTGVTGLDVSPYKEMIAYFDQYSGKLISKVGYKDYGILAKWFTWGIPLHEGHLFGWLNKLINLTVCLAFLFVIFWGFKTWLSRKRKGKFSAPPQVSTRFSISFIIFIIILGLIMPLFGISLIAVALIEVIIYLVNKQRKLTLIN